MVSTLLTPTSFCFLVWRRPETGDRSEIGIRQRLSRNYSFADKQERTVGRSKVVRKFLYRNFLPPEVQKGRYPCAASRPRCADTCSPFLSICRANAISCALPREMLKNADYTTFFDRLSAAIAALFFYPKNRTDTF